VLDAYGSPVSGARLLLNGPSSVSAVSDVRGNFEAMNLNAGEYVVRVEQSGYFLRLTKTSVAAQDTATLEVTLVQKPSTPGVVQKGQTLVAKGITFQGESTDVDATAAQSIAELADLLLTRTDLNIRIQGYGSDAVALSRALLIKQRLVDGGVPDSRIEAAGGGTGGKVSISIVQ
jgi:outer membrane protein OmpA-like peptidoglycan-associated protein